MDYQAILLSLLTGAGLVPVVGMIINLFEDFRPLNKGEKRIVAVVTTAVVSVGAYFLASLAGYIPNPFFTGDYQGMVNDLVMLFSVNFTTSQIVLSGFRSDTFQSVIGSSSRYTPKKTPAIKL